MLWGMRPLPPAYLVFTTTGAPFLPLAFRVAMSFGLMVIHLAVTPDPTRHLPGEGVYLGLLAFLFLESILEVGRNLKRTGDLFATPDRAWIRINLALDILLVVLLVAFQGADQERFATIFIFPVLASAFYLSISGIVVVAGLCALAHLITLGLFATGLLPPFGHSNATLGSNGGEWAFLLGFASIQIFAAALVVVVIRKHLETLRSSLQRSEATVDHLSAMYRRVFESLFSGLITVDQNGTVLSANPAASQILRRTLPPGDRVPELDLTDLPTYGSPSHERRFEQTFVTPDGHHRIVGGNIAPIRDVEGEPQGFLVLFQDLTELKGLEERTRLAERMATIGGLSASLAHELRNPMASILGCVQLLRRGEPDTILMDRALTILQRESDRVSMIVSDFLEYAKPRAVTPQSLWFPSVLDEVMASWETDPRRGSLVLRHETPPGLWVEGDPVHVHQVFTNLLSNARKAVATTPSPHLSLDFQHFSGEWLAVTLTDNGCGMSAETLESLYLPFVSAFPEGTGLGMALVYQFVQQMGWRIDVQSAVGKGTKVQLLLPVRPAPSALLP